MPGTRWLRTGSARLVGCDRQPTRATRDQVREDGEDVGPRRAVRVIAEMSRPPPAGGGRLVAMPGNLAQLQGERGARVLREGLVETIAGQGQVPGPVGLIPFPLEARGHQG